MKIEEVIKSQENQIELAKSFGVKGKVAELLNAQAEIIIDALKKQIPKEPTEHGENT